MLPSNVRTVCAGMACAACLVAAAVAVRSCQPAELGSIKVGSPSQWRREPAAPALRSDPKRVAKRTPPEPTAAQAPYKSIKDLFKDRNMNGK
jgi:hypothetical protein